MDENKLHEVRQWLLKARHDMRSARRLFTDNPPILDTAAYHCQQTAEKALKAFLAFHDVRFQKTHLLLPLVEECVEIEPEFNHLREAAEALTPFATVFRYPGDVVEPEVSDVIEGLALAQTVFDLVLRHLPEEVRD